MGAMPKSSHEKWRDQDGLNVLGCTGRTREDGGVEVGLDMYISASGKGAMKRRESKGCGETYCDNCRFVPWTYVARHANKSRLSETFDRQRRSDRCSD